MYSREISMYKAILLLIPLGFNAYFSKNMGYKFSPPCNPLFLDIPRFGLKTSISYMSSLNTSTGSSKVHHSSPRNLWNFASGVFLVCWFHFFRVTWPEPWPSWPTLAKNGTKMPKTRCDSYFEFFSLDFEWKMVTTHVSRVFGHFTPVPGHSGPDGQTAPYCISNNLSSILVKIPLFLVKIRAK